MDGSRIRYGVLAAMACGLAACGGGGEDGAPPAAPMFSSVPVTVIDGPIRHALVCLDRNGNGSCDAGEPAGRTAADGTVTLQVPPTDVGKFRVLAQVGTDAIDADHGKVETAFLMMAPADRGGLVSPLTTLVQQTAEATGLGTAEAEALLQRRLGTQASLFMNFAGAGGADAAQLGTIARLLVLVGQLQSRALAEVAGAKAIDGAAMKREDIESAIRHKLLQALPAVLAASADSRLADAPAPADRRRAFAAVAADLAASEGLTESSLPMWVAVARNPGAPRSTGVATASLLMLDYQRFGHWSRHVLTSSARQNTPDGDGTVRTLERHSRSFSGRLAEWGSGSAVNRQSDVHWNGKAWVMCDLDRTGSSGEPDAAGRSSYERCGGAEAGVEQSAMFDVSGRRMAAVYQQVREAGVANIVIAEPGPTLGSAVFPSGSRLSYSLRTPMRAAPAYPSALGSIPSEYATPLATGERQACDTPLTVDDFRLARTLSALVRAHRGTPCIDPPDAGSGPRNERWQFSTLSFAMIGTAPLMGSPGHYTTNRLLRVAFGDDRKVTYYLCMQRARDGAPLNCDVQGQGTYETEELGDATLMRLRGQPPLFASQPQDRIYVQRDGHVHAGMVSRLAPVRTARLNLAALNALQEVLGMPQVDPESRILLTEGSYQGIWVFDLPGGARPYGNYSLWLDEVGQASCAVDGTFSFRQCTAEVRARTGTFSFEDHLGSGSGVMRFVEGTATLRYTPQAGTPVDLEGRRR